MRFVNRVAVVTGAGRGIGRAHALLLAARGAAVVVNDRGVDPRGGGWSADPAEEVVAEIRRAGGTAIAEFSDLRTSEGATAVGEAALAEFGKVDVIVHNAGHTQGELHDIMSVHVDAAWWLVERVWEGMVARNYGRIVLTTSSGGLFGDGTGPGPNPKQAYSTAKMGVIGLTKALALRGRSAGITVNTIAPSAFTRLGELNRTIINTRADAPPTGEALDWMARNAPPEQVANGTLWLLHESCEVTGRIFNVGAGRVSEVYIGLTPGYTSPTGDLDPDAVPEHLAEVLDLTGGFVPIDQADYSRWVRSLVDRQRAGVQHVG